MQVDSSAAVAVNATDAASTGRASELAADLKLPFLGTAEARALDAGTWLLTVGEGGIAMQQSGAGAPGPVYVDFVRGKMGFRRQRPEATPTLIKAIGVKPGIQPHVWDLTAGLGQDAFILARHGCRVTLFERNLLVHALLSDGLLRARRCAAEGDEGLRLILERMELVAADSLQVLSSLPLTERPEVIYLDTMFPERSKSAKVKKGMQLFQEVVGEDRDADELLGLALERAEYRVVVKRPRLAPPLGEAKPSLSFTGKSIRFDVHARKKMSPA